MGTKLLVRMNSPWLFGNFVGILLRMKLWASVAEFHDLGHFEKSLNAIFVVLIPKKWGAEDLRSFTLLVWWEAFLSF